jgi:hypothetical protein
MRPLFSIRFIATVLAMAAVFAGLWLVLGRGDDAVVGGSTEPVEIERRIDLIQRAIVVQGTNGSDLVDGATGAEIRIALDTERTMVITANTPGEIDCPAIAELGGCVVVADLLGDAVVWFALISSEPRNTVTLPAVVEVRDNNRVLLANGWDVARVPTVERKCPEDTTSLGDFVRTFGENSRATFSFDEQRIVRVTCTQPDVADTVPATDGPVAPG